LATVPSPMPADEAISIEPDGHYEVINGQVVETPPLGVLEGWIASQLNQTPGPFANAGRLGRVVVEVLFQIDPSGGRKRRPDVAFVSRERWPIERPLPRGMAAWDIVPDLAVEIVSPSDLADEVVDKLADYFRAGVRLVWYVYPSQGLIYVYNFDDLPKAVLILGAGDELNGDAVLPGFRVPLATIFEDAGEPGTREAPASPA